MQLLENDHLRVSVSAHGAELTSVLDKTNGMERLWSGNAAIWNRHAPILFPIVGRLVGDDYTYQGKTYSLPQHGFARDATFIMRKRTMESLSYHLKDSERTHAVYPFPFLLQVDYILRENEVRVAYTVSNTGNAPMYFSIGAHPGFACPLLPMEHFSDYFVEFEKPETCARWYVDESGLIARKEDNYLQDTQVIPYTLDRFSEDALIFKDLASNKVSIKCNKNDRVVTLDFAGWPYLGIWSKPDGAPFICLEPWHGIADHVQHDGDLTTKEGIIPLDAGLNFCCEYGITFS